MLRWKTSVAAFLGVLAIASLAAAATVTVTPTAGATYDATTGANLGAGFLIRQQPSIYRVDLFATVGGSPAANEAFGAVSYDVGITGGATRNTLNVAGSGLIVPKLNYSPNNPALSNIADAGGTQINNMFSGGQNADLGTSLTDLIAITTAIDPANLGSTTDLNTGLPVADPRVAIGKSSPFLLGTVYVLNSTTQGNFALQNAQYSIANTTTHQLGATATLAGASLPIPPAQVPEPTTIALMAMGALGLVVMKVRRS